MAKLVLVILLMAVVALVIVAPVWDGNNNGYALTQESDLVSVGTEIGGRIGDVRHVVDKGNAAFDAAYNAIDSAIPTLALP